MVIVIGSINIDFIYSSNKFPLIGESVVGEKLEVSPGGKGANQAFHASKFGATKMIGGIGSDIYAKNMIEHLKKSGVNVDSVISYPGTTGSAFINVAEGDNKIVVVPGANKELTFKDILIELDGITESDIVLLQNEIDPSVVTAVCEYLTKINVGYIYNPAPYIEISDFVYKNAMYITPNETEYAHIRAKYGDVFDNKMIVTQGSRGVKLLKNNLVITCEKVKAVDTTGAGDTFSGVFAALVGVCGAENAARKACKVATETVMYKGAQGTTFKI